MKRDKILIISKNLIIDRIKNLSIENLTIENSSNKSNKKLK